MTEAQACAELAPEFECRKSDGGAGDPVGSVGSQKPASGASADEGSAVEIAVYSRLPQVPVPDAVGADRRGLLVDPPGQPQLRSRRPRRR